MNYEEQLLITMGMEDDEVGDEVDDDMDESDDDEDDDTEDDVGAEDE